MPFNINDIIGRLREFEDDHRLIDRIHKVMVACNHTWVGCGVPTVGLIRQEVCNLVDMVVDALRSKPDSPHVTAGTGGLVVQYKRYEDTWTAELIYTPAFLTKSGRIG